MKREFMRWFDLMGLQRHIKVLGIFARLLLSRRQVRILEGFAAGARVRAKPPPRAIRETAQFAEYIATHIGPRFEAAQRRAGAPT